MLRIALSSSRISGYSSASPFSICPTTSRVQLVLQVGYRSIRAAFPTPSRNRIGDVSSISSHTVDLL
jgi:hypothetical protein